VGYLIGRRGEVATASVCTCQSECAVCGGEGFVIARQDGYEVAQPCECAHLQRRVRRFDEARIPAEYGAKTIANFRADRFNRPLKVQLLRYTEKRFDVDKSNGLLIVGGPGTGKTHMLCSILRYLTLQRGIGCRFVDFFELTVQIRSTYDRASDLTESRVIDPLVEVPVLAIDELGKGRASHYERTIVDQLISRRYNAGRIVLATSNYLPEAMEAGDSGPSPGGERSRPTLEERVGQRIYSRLAEMCDILRTEGPDRRVVGF
jgi:DNA replication protein DnaC